MNEPYAINEKTIYAVKQGYFDFVNFLLQQDDEKLYEYLATLWNIEDYLGRMIIRVLQGRNSKVFYRCGAIKLSVGADTNGDLYPCGSMIGMQGCRIGSVFTGITDEAKRLYLDELLVTQKPSCKDCWARYLCGGGCYQSAFLTNKSVTQPDPCDCELMKYLYELAIYIAVHLQSKRPTVLFKLINRQ